MAQQSGIYAIGSGQSFATVPTPSGNNLSFFLNGNDGNKLYAMRSDRSVFLVPAGVAPIDNKVSVSAADTTPSFLEPKLVAGTGISIVKNNPGANETLTINSTGGGVDSESGSFSRLAVDGSGVQIIPTTKRVKGVWFYYNGGGPPDIIAIEGQGWSNGTVHSSVYMDPNSPPSPPAAVNGRVAGGFCINFQNSAGNGFAAFVSAIGPASFTVTWFVIGAGKDVTVDWMAITQG